MFEAVVTLCLALDGNVCRDRLLPGYIFPTVDDCTAALAEDLPEVRVADGLSVPEPPRCHPAGAALPVTEVAPGLYVHTGAIAEPDATNRGDVANLGFVIGRRSVAVIDTGSAPWIAEALWRAIRQRTDLPVSHVILTHMHPDHVFGLSAFEGAEIVTHAHLPRALADRQENYIDSLRRLIGAEAMVGAALPAVNATVEPGETREIDLGARVLTLAAWPLAHTGTDLTVLDSETGTLVAGDLVFDRHTPALDGSVTGWRAVLTQLEALDARSVVPGHGGPILDWPAGAEPLARYLAVLEADTRAAIDAGRRLGDAVETIAASEAAHWSLFEAYNPRNATVAFTELEWE